MNDHDTHTPSLDGPAGMTLGAPRYRTLRIVINGPDDSEPPIVIERHDWPVDDNDELGPADVDPACVEAAARVRAAFASGRTDSPSPDAQAPHADAFTPEAGEAEPDDAKASQRGAQREGTPVLYPAERGRR